MNLKQLSSVAALLLLAACAQPNLPQQNSWQAAEQVQDFSADGRLAVKVEGKGSYANFDWTYQNAVQTNRTKASRAGGRSKVRRKKGRCRAAGFAAKFDRRRHLRRKRPERQSTMPRASGQIWKIEN